MNCKKCGKEIAKDYQYCYECGNTLFLNTRERITGESLTEPSSTLKKLLDIVGRYPKLSVVIFLIIIITSLILIFK